jgi:hypothetical protein
MEIQLASSEAVLWCLSKLPVKDRRSTEEEAAEVIAAA